MTSKSLWTEVVEQKYSSLRSIIDWVHSPTKKINNAYRIWKCMVSSFEIIHNGLAWSIGNGNSVRIGMDLWPESRAIHILPLYFVERLLKLCLFTLNQVANPHTSNLWT